MSLRRNDVVVTADAPSRMHQVLSAGLPRQNRVAATGFTFLDMEYDPSTHPDGSKEYRQFRGFESKDIWDTLTDDLFSKILNAPDEYNKTYQKEVNVALLTAIKTLLNLQEQSFSR